MNVKTMWIPLAFVASIVATSVGAEGPMGAPASTEAPRDLCAQLDEFGNPARCEPIGPDMAPWWDAEVCCDGQGCVEPGAEGCAAGFESYWCESAELHSDGSLTCVYEVPAYCDLNPCEPLPDYAPEPDIQEHAICCYEIGCYDHEGGPCGGFEVWCGDGVSNADGTVTCFD